ncbi:MAG TPA: amidohydrolase family protein [Vicinamibacterales bacterium]|nr:amidohydrolase family protein [Vicinamibacterales bacterium]
MPASHLSRRELLAGASVGAAALLLESERTQAQPAADRPVVFTHTSVITVDAVRHDVALAVQGGRIAAIGPTDDVLPRFPQAEVYDGRGKALLPGLINCHAHLGATIARGFNEDYGFPNSYKLPVQPGSLMSAEEHTLMAVVGALEAIKTGSTTVTENVAGTASTAAALAKTGLRWVFAESATDREGGSPMSPEILARGEAPRFSPKMRDDGLARIADLHSAWHGKENGRITVFPAAGLAENSSPELLHAVRAFAEKHDLGYTIHLSQSRAEVAYMRRHHGVSPVEFLARHDFLSPRLFAAHCRYVDTADIALLAKTGTMVTHQAGMAANRGAPTPIPALRAAGVPIAYGTDNNTTDMFSVLRTSMLVERIQRGDDAIPGMNPQPEDVLEDATLGSARAVRQVPAIGSLEVGKKADILVLDTQRVHLVPAVRILSAWIHNGQPNDIETVMIDGRFVMRDRKILTMDEAAIIADADRVGRRVWAKVQESGPIAVPGRPRKR